MGTFRVLVILGDSHHLALDRQLNGSDIVYDTR